MPFATIEEKRAYHKKYMQDHRDKLSAMGKRWRLKRKLSCFKMLGNECACCGESTFEFLQLDHINGGGRKERFSIGNYVYRRVELEGYPKDKYQLLCANCNWSKGTYGTCPHNK